MTVRYAKDQEIGFKNAIERVAVVGAAGTVGSHIVAALLKTGRHTLTALSRKVSENKFPDGVHVATVDYDDEDSLVAALKDQQFLIITMSPAAPRDSHSRLVKAAAKAGVPYVMPNGYAGDIENVKLGVDTFLGPITKAQRDEIESLGMSWTTVCCGFWYEYSLAGGELRFGFDFDKMALTLYDDGDTAISTSTLSQIGYTVAQVLSLKELPDDENDQNLSLAAFRNKAVFVNSFSISQNNMFESVKRVTGTTDADWTVVRKSSKQRYEDGVAEFKGGNPAGFIKLLYSRGFYPDESNAFSAKVQNEMLGLPDEILDEHTKIGINMAKTSTPRLV